MMGHAENARQAIHIAMVGFALLLRYLTWPQAALMACAALLFNLAILPRLGGTRLLRPSEYAAGRSLGILFYPFAVLALVVVFPARLDIAAAAWGILAVGDGCATLVGHRLDGPTWPWNPSKTVAGTAALVVAGGAAGACLAVWTRPTVDPAPTWTFSLAAPFLAALAAGFVETIPIRLDDNLTVPFSAAAVLWACSTASMELARAAAPLLIGRTPAAIALNLAVALAGETTRAVARSGTIAGAVVGTIVYIGAGPGGWLLLFASFLAATTASRSGWRRKALLGIQEAHGGRRGATNVMANCGVAAVAAMLIPTSRHAELAALAAVAALAAGASDTVASEIGKAWGRRTLLVSTLARVPPGTPGAISAEGTAAGIAAAFGLALVGAAVGVIPTGWAWIAAAAATLGSAVESLLGATLEGPGIVNNDVLNFLNTSVAAASAVLLARSVA